MRAQFVNESYGKIVSKKEVGDTLKNEAIFGRDWDGARTYGAVKMRASQGFGRHIPDKPYKSWEGITPKGFRGGSHGPMTSTNAHLEHNREIEQKVIKALAPLAEDYTVQNGAYIFKFNDGKKGFTMKFTWMEFPTYTRNVDLDPGYRTWWFVGKYI